MTFTTFLIISVALISYLLGVMLGAIHGYRLGRKRRQREAEVA